MSTRTYGSLARPQLRINIRDSGAGINLQLSSAARLETSMQLAVGHASNVEWLEKNVLPTMTSNIPTIMSSICAFSLCDPLVNAIPHVCKDL